MLILLVCVAIFAVPMRAQDGVTVEVRPHREGVCSGGFVEHRLEHTTTVRETPVRMYSSNGSGLAIGDLNGDGLPEIVLGNLNGSNTILWNRDSLMFEAETLRSLNPTRGVYAVDVDGDSSLDIVTTNQTTAPSWWRNSGDGTFEQGTLAGVLRPAYALDWGDLDGDGDLDLVTGSYDSELEQLLKNSFLFGGGAGVFYYEQQDGEFIPTRLAEESQALAVFLVDLNGDSQLDIAIGNDFGVPDAFWTRQDGVWEAFNPFTVTTFSTMSFDAGDINNDGDAEFYAADMKPYQESLEIQDIWQPVLASIAPVPEDDPQVMENTLQTIEDAAYVNQAQTLGVDATGWSWSSKFGDLDSDGFLDLYVVNGMIALDLFPHLPDNALIEENQAFRNVEGQRFEPAPEWGLGLSDSGRGMSMADMDHDGDLDIVVNNLLTPAVLLENQVCGGGNLTVDLRRMNALNTHGLGAVLTLHTSTGTYTRTIRASSGYLSGDAPRVHFGVPSGAEIEALEIAWGDGVISRVDDVTADTHITVTRAD